MKIRNGFVSNSSSSSFVCEITGEAFEVRDGCFWEVDLCQCKNGHIFKKKFLVPWKPKFPSKEEMLTALDGITDSKRACMRFREMNEFELQAAYAKAFMSGQDEHKSNVNQCPICTLTLLGDSMLLDFLLKKSHSSRTAVLAQIQKECENFGQLQRYLTNN